MTFALTAFVANGIEVDEAVTKRFLQRATFTITAANTNVAVDIGNYTGTFWTAVGGSEVGTKALLAIKDIQTRALSFVKAGGTGLADRVQADASYTTYVKLTGTVSGGGSSETVTVAGLATSSTDTILAVTQGAPNATPTVAVTGYDTQSAGTLKVYFAANPGANGVVNVLVSRASTAVQAGTYQLALNATNTQIPDILFVSGDAPTAYTIVLEWVLAQDQPPVQVAA